MAKTDRQQARLRTMAISHLNIAASHLEQAKSLIKAGVGHLAVNHLQKALASIEGAHDNIPISDVGETRLYGNAEPAPSTEQEGTPSEPATVGVDRS